jgi:bifunctional non-homologous end joining protein LigD
MPEFIEPMLATLVDEAFDDDNWLFEVKWDGFRALSFVQGSKVEIKSRNNLSFNEKFSAIVSELKKLKSQVILDGEVVVIDESDKSHFQLIQNYKNKKNHSLVYYVFDILIKDGIDLRSLPLIERKEILKKYLEQLSLPFIRYSDHVIAKGIELFKAAAKMSLEGIIGKKITSEYVSKRSRDWVKIKSLATQEIIICGFTKPRGAREKFGALIAGIYNKENELAYAGHVGGGFTDAELLHIYNLLKELKTAKCPFKKTPKVNTSVTWVKPLLIAEVTFTEWTEVNSMRHPVFKGLRADMDNPKKIVKEVSEPLNRVKQMTGKTSDLKLTHLEKIYWSKEKITKGDLIDYYESIAPFILPYLKDRPIMLHRYPDGIEGKDFYQKDLNFNPPVGIKTFELMQEGKINNYLLINDVHSLLYAINLGSIDLHPFLSHTKTLQHPDYCVIDLDPHEIAFSHVIEVALALDELLNNLKIKHFCKTSGGKGLHILIPLKAKYDYEQSRQFAEIICMHIQKLFPKTTSMERSPQKRPKKIYLDCLQNRLSQSIVAPYAVRPRPFANVSTPLLWEEVNESLEIGQFNIHTVPARLAKMGDVMKGVLSAGINMQKALSAIKSPP